MTYAIPIEFIAFLGIFIGVFARTYFPYKTAKDEARVVGEAISFDFKFIMTAFISVLITSALVFSTFVIPQVGAFEVFLAGLVFGYGIDAFMNRYAASASTPTKIAPVSEPLTKIPSEVSPASDLQFKKPD